MINLDRQIRTSRQLKADIPKLRRFARALTGNQTYADTCVVRLMDDVLADLDQFCQSTNLKAALYRRLSDIIDFSTSECAEEMRFSRLTPQSRKAYWLAAVEDFCPADAAEVLSIGVDELRNAVASSRVEIAADRKVNILIIEDEMFIATDLVEIATSIGHMIVGVARTADESIAQFKLNQPDLILSDVQLADGSSGIDAVDSICRIADTPAIFITAYQERFLTGRHEEPTYLISKPFKAEAVKATISQAVYLNGLRWGRSSSERGVQV